MQQDHLCFKLVIIGLLTFFLGSTTSTVKAASDYLLIDSTGPFLTQPQTGIINWSKIPFAYFELNSQLDMQKTAQATEDFKTWLELVDSWQIDGITLDDLAHATNHPFYTSSLQTKLSAYQMWYEQLMDLAQQKEIDVFLTSDVLFNNQQILEVTKGDFEQQAQLLEATIEQAFIRYPSLDGIVLRIGEPDGNDVRGDFASQLLVTNPSELRALITQLEPLFQKYDKRLIVRTWAVGAFDIGDINWNLETFNQVFLGLDSERVWASTKFGASDFFRYLPLSDIVRHSQTPILVELQPKAEYETLAGLPSFWGFLWPELIEQAKQNPNVVGFSLWVHTGGWSRRQPLPFFDTSSFWVELNTLTAIEYLRHPRPMDQILMEICDRKVTCSEPEALLRQAHLVDQAISQGLYVEEFARKSLFFRRAMLPPLLWVYWDTIQINSVMTALFTRTVTDPELAIRQAEQAQQLLSEAASLSKKTGDTTNYEFAVDTMKLLTLSRVVLLSPQDIEAQQQLKREYAWYHQQYPSGYELQLEDSSRWTNQLINLTVPILVRPVASYRKIDEFMISKPISYLFRLVLTLGLGSVSGVGVDRAADLRTLFL